MKLAAWSRIAKMRIASINDAPGLSVGAIMKAITWYGWIQNQEMYTFSPTASDTPLFMPGHFFIGTKKSHLRHKALAEWTGLNGFFEIGGTLQLIKKLDELQIELIHLHNLNGFVLNLPIFFRYVRKKQIPVVWSLYSSWSFTGKCGHYSGVGCDRWQTGCGKCPQLHVWPESKFLDSSSFLWHMKKNIFTSVPNMTIVASSEWIASEAKKSFLGGHRIVCIPNGINTYIFSPTPSNFRQIHNCENKTILLGVASGWTHWKGLDTMIEISRRMDNKYQVVLVGLPDEKIADIPRNVIAFPKIKNQKELAKIYSAADIFLQPTMEDTSPIVNLEALACGTPIITYRTDGSPESIDETCGRVVERGDIDGMIAAIKEQAETHAMTEKACVARAQNFTQEKMCERYFTLYRDFLQ